MMLQLVKRHSLEIKVTDCFDMSKFFFLKEYLSENRFISAKQKSRFNIPQHSEIL